MGLHCNSEDNGVSLSWHTDQPIETFIKSGQNGSYLLVFLKRKQAPIQFTCISRTNTDNSTSAVSLKCEDQPLPNSTPSPAPCRSTLSPCHRQRSGLFISLGFTFGFLTAVITYCCKDRVCAGAESCWKMKSTSP